MFYHGITQDSRSLFGSNRRVLTLSAPKAFSFIRGLAPGHFMGCRGAIIYCNFFRMISIFLIITLASIRTLDTMQSFPVTRNDQEFDLTFVGA